MATSKKTKAVHATPPKKAVPAAKKPAPAAAKKAAPPEPKKPTPAAAKKAAPPAAKKPAPAAPSVHKAAPKEAAPSTAALHPFDDKKPDASATTVSTFARALATHIRTDAEQLVFAKLSPSDADEIDALADALDAKQAAWSSLRDESGVGAVAAAREPMRASRNKLFSALRTFADNDARTQSALDDIGNITGDDDLVDDTTRLLALAKKHHADLVGTDITKAWLTNLASALAGFKAARAGSRQKDGDPTTSQEESAAARKARRARNRAFWELGECCRRACRRGQYAFLNDPAKRANYTLYRRGSSEGSTASAPTSAGESEAAGSTQ